MYEISVKGRDLSYVHHDLLIYVNVGSMIINTV